jgi:hypothetical protein
VTNACGSCNMCCKVMGIPELQKRDGEWCRHVVKGVGCGIYANRPTRCQEFLCGWRHGIFKPGEEPPELRPDRCHVVFAPASQDDMVICAFVDPARPDAYLKPVVMDVITKLCMIGCRVVISFDDGPHKRIYYKTGPQTVGHRAIEMTPPDENGIQWYKG